MKVGIVSAFFPTEVGGAEASLAALVPALGDHGVDIAVLTFSESSDFHPAAIRLAQVPRALKIATPPLVGRWMSRALESAATEQHLDLIHVNDVYTLGPATFAARSLNLPLVLAYHNNVGIPHRSFGITVGVSAWLDFRERTTLQLARRADAVIADSDFTAHALIRAGLSPKRVVAVYIDGAIALRETAPFPSSALPVRISAVGRVYEHKGFQDLVSALALLRGRGMGAEARIAGTGPFQGSLARHIVSAGLQGSVQLAGRLATQSVLRLIDSSHIVVVPSRTPEPFGRVAVEAMSRARPVVASRIGGLAEVFDDGISGMYVQPGKPAELADAIALIGRGRDAELMGLAGRERSASLFEARAVASQVIDVWAKVLADRRQKASR